METKESKKVSAIVEVIDGGPLKITGQIILRDPKRHISDNPFEVYL